MGNTDSSECSLTDAEIVHFVKINYFTALEVKALWHHFMRISGRSGTIDRSKFQEAVLFRETTLIDRIFVAFDVNHNGFISFADYIKGLSMLSSKATVEEKLEFSFKIYDKDQDKCIGVKELNDVLIATLNEHNLIIKSEEIDQIIEATFKEADTAIPGKINFQEYSQIVTKNPGMLGHLSLNVSTIIEEYAAMSI